MAPQTTKKQVPLVFDASKFQQMVPPFYVRVERMEGNAAQVVPLPIKEGQEAPGPGWSADDVLNLEQAILGAFGGGTYRFQVTDTSNEQMVWSQMFPVNVYPKRPLSPEVAPAMPQQPQQQPTGFGGMPINWNAPPPGYPGFAPGFPPGFQPQYPPQFYPQPQMPAYGAYPPFASFRPGAPGSPVDDVTRLRQEAEAARLTAQEERHKAEMQRVMDASQRAVDELRRSNEQRPRVDEGMQARLEHEREERRKAELAAEQTRFEATIKSMEARMEAQAHRPTGPSEADIRMQRLEDDARRREDQQRQDAALAQIREENRRREDMLMAQLTELKANRTDPMMTFILQQMQSQNESAKEIARVQADAAKENARIQAELQRERTREQEVLIASMKPFMMAPAEMARMMSDKDSSQHQFVRSMATTFNDVAGVMRDWFANMAQMVGGQGESPVVGLAKDAIESAKDMFKTYNDGKSQVQAAQANAQREYIRAQAQANQPQQPQQPQTWQPPPPVAQPSAQAGGLNGANSNGAAPAAPPAPSPLRKGGKTDEEWFGVAIDDIRDMRGQVATYQIAIAQDPPDLDPKTKQPRGMSPDQSAQTILTAAQIIEAKRIPGVYAFEYLYKNEMYSDLVEVLLPDASAAYRTDAVRYLYHRLGQGPNPATPAPVPLPVNPPINGTGADQSEDGKDDDHDGKALVRS
jgi:hypothetical protein